MTSSSSKQIMQLAAWPLGESPLSDLLFYGRFTRAAFRISLFFRVLLPRLDHFQLSATAHDSTPFCNRLEILLFLRS